ncbi:MAG: hypothetical protein R3C56_35250 [Pirellulaceae bacterium]
MPVPDFSRTDRPKTCLEVDFPIPQINELSSLEGNAGKPIYQMSKWWARSMQQRVPRCESPQPSKSAINARRQWELDR